MSIHQVRPGTVFALFTSRGLVKCASRGKQRVGLLKGALVELGEAWSRTAHSAGAIMSQQGIMNQRVAAWRGREARAVVVANSMADLGQHIRAAHATSN